MNTTLAKQNIEKKWYVIDAKDQILGHLAVKIANLLRGRNKPIYTPHIDTGDFVIVVNVDKVKLTGKKMDNKKYMFYTRWRGNERYVKASDMDPRSLVRLAVKGMIPPNKLRAKMMTKLRLFSTAEHPHEAQNPIPYNV